LESPKAFGLWRFAPANRLLREKKIFWDWQGPWQIVADFKASQGIYQNLRTRREWGRGVLPQGRNTESTKVWTLLNLVRTYYQGKVSF